VGIDLTAELVNRLNVIAEGKAIAQIQGRVDRFRPTCYRSSLNIKFVFVSFPAIALEVVGEVVTHC
jgi:hypothetical protein